MKRLETIRERHHPEEGQCELLTVSDDLDFCLKWMGRAVALIYSIKTRGSFEEYEEAHKLLKELEE